MSDNRSDILTYFRTLSKPELLEHLEEVLVLLEEKQLDDWLGDWQFQKGISDKPDVDIIEAFKDFKRRSLAGEYYAPFEINSKNFIYVPPETDMWFSELGRWVDVACKAALAGNLLLAKPILDGCMFLLDEMSNDRIVFADEYGEWMLVSRHDYKAIYQQMQAG